MKQIILAIAVTLAFTSCYNEPKSTAVVGNGVKVEFLFEYDGIKVYRFCDGGRTHYFTNKGEVMSKQTEGKSEYDDETN